MKNTSLKIGSRLIAGFATLAVLAPVAAHAQSPEPSTLEKFVSTLTGESNVSLDGWIAFGAILIGFILAVLYFRGMYLVLHYASETYDVSLDAVDDAEYSSKGERRLLYIGSIALVVLSGLIISSYGFGWLFLYIGPALTLFGPVVIIISMEVDIRKYRHVLRERAIDTTGALPLDSRQSA